MVTRCFDSRFDSIDCPRHCDAHHEPRQDVLGLPWRAHEAGLSVLDRIDNERRLRRELGLAPDVQAEGLARQAVSRV